MSARSERDPELAQRQRRAFMAALRELDQALSDNIDRAQRMRARIAELQAADAAGTPIRDTVPGGDPPLIVQLLTESSDALHVYGSRVRRSEARALYGEGLTMEAIAGLFGVTRQRVSALLRDDTTG